MFKGTVKWFSSAKGFGFIAMPDKDVFVHFSDIVSTEQFVTLLDGDLVEFELYDSIKRGYQAKNVRKVGI